MDDLLDEITPVSPEEYTWLALQEYDALITGSGIILLRAQCRVIHPSEPMTICIRKKGHSGLHVATNPVSTWPKTLLERRYGGAPRKARFG